MQVKIAGAIPMVDASGDVMDRSVAFTTLMLFQIFNVVNARSDEHSALPDLFTNKWLWVAIGASLALQVAVVYAPFLQRAFGTVGLSGGDWLFSAAIASSVLWFREISKLVSRTVRTV
jgi:Ca2+-transporting ATPase